MADDIGPGDVVECIDPDDFFALHSRWRVRAVGPGTGSHTNPDQSVQPCDGGSLRLRGVPDWWCTCSFRKIGGSRADTVRRFAEDLNAADELRRVLVGQ